MIDQAAIIEECAKVADGYNEPNRFSVINWENETPTEIYNMAAADVAVWIAKEIRALAAVPPARPSIPEREKVLEALNIGLTNTYYYGENTDADTLEDQNIIAAAIAALEAK